MTHFGKVLSICLFQAKSAAKLSFLTSGFIQYSHTPTYVGEGADETGPTSEPRSLLKPRLVIYCTSQIRFVYCHALASFTTPGRPV